MPTYNESPTRIMAGLEAIDDELRDCGATICSTSSSSATPPIRTSGSRRKRPFSTCASGPAAPDRIFYRHRPKNTARKAGNIAEWVARFGGAYPQFLILDADSVMRGDTLIALVTRDGGASRMSG